jgi:hypothetical protein
MGEPQTHTRMSLLCWPSVIDELDTNLHLFLTFLYTVWAQLDFYWFAGVIHLLHFGRQAWDNGCARGNCLPWCLGF